MRPYRIRVGLDPVMGVLLKVGNVDTGTFNSLTDRVGPRETEAGNGVMCLPAKECTGLLATARRWERGLGQILRRSPEKEPTLQTA